MTIKRLLGSAPSQVSRNKDLGGMAFQDAANVTQINVRQTTDTTNIGPSLLLDFANSKTLDPRITFTRSTTGTFYNGISSALAEQNLLAQSNNLFSYSAVDATLSINTSVAPNGTTTASTLTATASTAFHTVSLAVWTGTYTVSIFAKAGTNNFIQFSSDATSAIYANFNLSTGALGTVGASAAATITSVGSSWYRCTMTFTHGSAATVRLNIIDSATSAWRQSWTTAGTETVLLWGVQIEQRSAATAYTPTTTQAITNYIPTLQTAAIGVARFDHNPITGESLGLLVEESRANLLSYSSDMSNAAWDKSGCTINYNANVAPDGTQSANLLVTILSVFPIRPFNWTSGTTYTLSTYAKAYTGSSVGLRVQGAVASQDQLCLFNLSNGTYAWSGPNQQAGATASINSVGNGWFRCSITYSANTTASGYISASGTGIFVWGTQLEAGPFATSYIPTLASAVTRGGEYATLAGTNFSSWFSRTGAVWYFEARYPFSVSPGSNRYTLDTGAGANPTAIMGAGVTSMSVFDFSTYTDGPVVPLANFNKFAIALTQNNKQVFTNGIAGVQGSHNGILLNLPVLLNIGNAANTFYMKKLAFYPSRLANAEIQEMTA
jgi:hypothetical protein